MIDLTVNGKPRQAEDNSSLETYLLTIDVDLKFVAVGYNGEVIPVSYTHLTLPTTPYV